MGKTVPGVALPVAGSSTPFPRIQPAALPLSEGFALAAAHKHLCGVCACVCRGEVLYGGCLWSSGHRGGYDEGGFDDFAAGVLGLSASEEAEGECVRRAAVSVLLCRVRSGLSACQRAVCWLCHDRHRLCGHAPFTLPELCSLIDALCLCTCPLTWLLQLREAEPLRHIKLSRLLTDKLNAAAAVHGPKLSAAMAAVDPVIQQQVQAMMAAAGAAHQ